jgi:hypothetical protein
MENYRNIGRLSSRKIARFSLKSRLERGTREVVYTYRSETNKTANT